MPLLLLGLLTDQEYADAQTFYEDLGALAQQKGYVEVSSADVLKRVGMHLPWFNTYVGVACHKGRVS